MRRPNQWTLADHSLHLAEPDSAAELDQSCLKLRIVETSVDLLVELAEGWVDRRFVMPVGSIGGRFR
jgi:hypothetical protein